MNKIRAGKTFQAYAAEKIRLAKNFRATTDGQILAYVWSGIYLPLRQLLPRPSEADTIDVWLSRVDVTCRTHAELILDQSNGRAVSESIPVNPATYLAKTTRRSRTATPKAMPTGQSGGTAAVAAIAKGTRTLRIATITTSSMLTITVAAELTLTPLTTVTTIPILIARVATDETAPGASTSESRKTANTATGSLVPGRGSRSGASPRGRLVTTLTFRS
jgi:hypothetical protein